MTKGKFAANMAALQEVLGGPVLSPIATELYWQILSELSDDRFDSAVKRAARECKFFPKPAELLEMAGVSPAVNAAVAWEAVIGAIHQHDYTTSVDFGVVVNAVIRNMGGWTKLCDMKKSETPFERKRFEELCEAFSRRPPSELSGGHLSGEYGGAPQRVHIPGAVYAQPKALPSAEESVRRMISPRSE